MSSNWSSIDDEILIDFVRIHEALYNVKSKEYRQSTLKQKLWCEVGEILHKTDSDCYKRWCYVRDYYIRRKGKPGTGSSGEAAKKRSDLLSFLDTLPSSQRNSITNIVENENAEENIQDYSEKPSQHHETNEITYENYEGDSNSKGDCNNYDDINKDIDSTEESSNTKSNKKRKNITHAQERLNLLKQIAQRKPPTQNELDENDLFFSSMAKIVKKLPRYEQVQIRMQVGPLVGYAELRYISIDSPPTIPSTCATDYSEISPPITNTGAGTVPVSTRPGARSIAINDEGKIYFVSKDNMKLQ